MTSVLFACSTLELSQLSFVLPGTNSLCTVLGVTNNLLSILHSWQLVFQPGSKGLTAAAATGALLLNSTGEHSCSSRTRALVCTRQRPRRCHQQLDPGDRLRPSAFACLLAAHRFWGQRCAAHQPSLQPQHPGSRGLR